MSFFSQRFRLTSSKRTSLIAIRSRHNSIYFLLIRSNDFKRLSRTQIGN
jgi:hypothetical protein